MSLEHLDGSTIEILNDPKGSFEGQSLESPWSNLQLVYFVGTSMWTYLTQPFTYALPGFETFEAAPWSENGESWRRLSVTWPDRPVGHCRTQTLYVGDKGLIKRFDYQIDIMGGAPGVHYLEGYSNVAGIMVPVSHRIFARDEKNEAVWDPLLISIDVDSVTFAEC